MNKRQKEILQYQLAAEKAILKQLEKYYSKALKDIEQKIRLYQADELTQSRIYHIQYQKALKKQVEAALEQLHSNEYGTIQQYLSETYRDGYIGTMYDLAGQGMPVLAPVDRRSAIKAVMTDSQLKQPLYDELGVDVTKLKKIIRSEITRGVASGAFWGDIARNISFHTNAPLKRAKLIVRTEAHRIQEASAEDARQTAKRKGADVVKQWDATLDGDTRPTHRALDGQIRETDEPFEMDGKTAMYPGGFGDPAEDCNCRCVALTRARAALDENELEVMRERAAFFELDKSKDFEDFKRKYLKAAESVEKSGKSGIIKTDKQFGKKIGKHAVDYGLDPRKADDREQMRMKIDEICSSADEVAHGDWRGQPEPVKFYIKGDDVVVATEDDVFITILKGGTSNERVKNARGKPFH